MTREELTAKFRANAVEAVPDAQASRVVALVDTLATQPRLLILDEPTRGIDIAAKEDLMRAVAELARTGTAVLFISAEISEVLRESHRVVVLRERRKVGELPGGCDEQSVYALIAEHA